MAARSRRLLVGTLAIVFAITHGQPFVNPEFSAPATPAETIKSPSSTPGMIIMGVCLVSLLATAFIILALVVCLYKQKAKEIDLSKPLILTEEVGKKKKRKGKKEAISTSDKSFNPSDEVELVASGGVESTRSDTPPRAIDTVSFPSSPESARAANDRIEDGSQDEEGSTDEESE